MGRRIAATLSEKAIPFVVIEQNRDFVEKLRERNIHAVSGNGSEPEVLIQGHVARARMLVIATPETVHVRKMVEIARMLNPRIEIVVRTHSDEEADLLRRDNVGEVFMGEHELASGHDPARAGALRGDQPATMTTPMIGRMVGVHRGTFLALQSF